MTASIETNQREAIARRYVAEVFTGGNAERARDYFTADIAWHGGVLGTITGVDNVVPVLGGFIGALSDIQATVQDDAITTRRPRLVRRRRTRQSPGVPATGRPVRWTPSTSTDQDDGRIRAGVSRTWPRSSARARSPFRGPADERRRSHDMNAQATQTAPVLPDYAPSPHPQPGPAPNEQGYASAHRANSLWY